MTLLWFCSILILQSVSVFSKHASQIESDDSDESEYPIAHHFIEKGQPIYHDIVQPRSPIIHQWVEHRPSIHNVVKEQPVLHHTIIPRRPLHYVTADTHVHHYAPFIRSRGGGGGGRVRAFGPGQYSIPHGPRRNQAINKLKRLINAHKRGKLAQGQAMAAMKRIIQEYHKQ